MKKKGVKFLIAGILVLGSYAGYDYWSAERSKQSKAEDAKLVPFKKDQITEIRIEEGENRFFMKRGIEGWFIEAPIKDWAETESVDIFLNTLDTEFALDAPVLKVPIDWTLYGLEKPHAKITITNSTQQSIVYSISEQKNYEQNTFLRKNKENKVYVVNATWQSRAKKGVAELRDLRLLRHKMARISSIDFKNRAGHLKLKQKDGRWIDAKQPTKKIDQNKVYLLLQSTADTRAEAILGEVKITAKQKYTHFLDKPVAELTLNLGEKTWTVLFSQPTKHEIYALVSDPVFLMKIETGNIDKFFETKPDDFFEQEKK